VSEANRRIPPGTPLIDHPESAGPVLNESFNGKLCDELLNGEIFYTLKEAPALMKRWRVHYSPIRVHEPEKKSTRLDQPRGQAQKLHKLTSNLGQLMRAGQSLLENYTIRGQIIGFSFTRTTDAEADIGRLPGPGADLFEAWIRTLGPIVMQEAAGTFWQVLSLRSVHTRHQLMYSSKTGLSVTDKTTHGNLIALRTAFNYAVSIDLP